MHNVYVYIYIYIGKLNRYKYITMHYANLYTLLVTTHNAVEIG